MSVDASSSEKMRAAKRASSEPPSLPQPSGSHPRVASILLVEDEVSLGRAMLRWLRDYKVVHCTGIAEALMRIRAGERFDLILCDVMMPGGNAPDFYEALLKEAPALAERILFMTGGATTPETVAFVAAQSWRLITKPLDLADLRRRVAEFIAQREAPGDPRAGIQ
jgi:DNA-binding NtrC family response regulator